MDLRIIIKDINKLAFIDVTTIYGRLSWPDAGSDSSMQKELDKRYVNPTPGPHPEMALALIWWDGFMVGWVGTRPWTEMFKGVATTVQTVECFVDERYRRRGFAQLGLQALMTAGFLVRDKPVAVYRQSVVKTAKRCGCQIVLLRTA